MKKLFLGMAAVALLASCSNDEIIEQSPKTPISFKSFVDKSTRAVTPDLASKVWGWQDDTPIFTAEAVANDGSYTNKAYWVTGQAYEFVAVAPQSVSPTVSKADGSSKGKIVINNYENNGTTDLLFTTASVPSLSDLASAPTVPLTFKHMLSKIKFTFKYAMSSSVHTVKVSNISVSNAVKTGTLTAQGTTYNWSDWETNPSLTINFDDNKTKNGIATIGSASDEMLMIPGQTAFTVNFTTTLETNGVQIAIKNHTVSLTNQTLAPGYSYNYTAELNDGNVVDTGNLKPITFTVTDGGWTDADQVLTW